jgi:hypothetical protein
MKKSERVVTGALTFDLNEHGKRTRILDTLRPATESEEVLREMIRAGMDVSRINFSHVSRHASATCFHTGFSASTISAPARSDRGIAKTRILWSLLASRPAQVLGREPKEASALPGFAPR